jgi:sn-glycerol 3-phosphate transport system substrate-binding protein
MVQDGLALNIGDPTGANGPLAVGAGKAVMVLSYLAALRSIFDVLARGIEGVELGVAPVPGIPGRVPQGSPSVYSRSLWIMSARPKKERDAPWMFIKWLMEPEQQADWFAGSGYLPSATPPTIRQPRKTPSPAIRRSRYRPTSSRRPPQQPPPWARSSVPSSRCGKPS